MRCRIRTTINVIVAKRWRLENIPSIGPLLGKETGAQEPRLSQGPFLPAAWIADITTMT